MRSLEIVIPILLAVYLLWPHPHPLIIRLVPAAALIVMLVHFTLEGYRWQMIPLYALTLILTALLFFISDIKPIASTLTLILLAASTALPILLPVPKIAAPSGQFDVGATIYEFTDTARKELYSGKDEAHAVSWCRFGIPKVTSTAKARAWMLNRKSMRPQLQAFLICRLSFLTILHCL
jgi:hypothetical protein